MDKTEMSNLFDVLYNNITSNQAPGLNEYEKSVFLTKAQDEVLKNYFLPQSNPKQAGFDSNPKRQIDFSMLMRSSSSASITDDNLPAGFSRFDPRSGIYSLPVDVFIIVNEQLVITHRGSRAVAGIRQVVPISMDEYTRLMSKPFKEPLKYQAWRLLTNTGTNGLDPVGLAEIIHTSADRNKYIEHMFKYNVRYIKRPQPIILTDLTDTFGEGLLIHGKSEATDCELDPILHEEIVQRAVELAKVAWQGDVQTVIQAGQRSE